jgi:leucyl aminopeptidase
MKVILILFLCSLALSKEPKRLIAFNESYSEWMSLDEASALESSTRKFMDITAFQNPKIKNFFVDPIPTKVTRQALVNQLSPLLNWQNLKNTITDLSNFYTRYYNSATGKQAAQYVFEKFQTYAQGRNDIDVEYFQHTFQMPSVIARIRGASNDKGATRIILGGHEDSVGKTSTGRSPGADDDASGTSTVLEVFRVLSSSGFKPERTVEFHAYSGEEGGLLGSQAIAKQYSDLDIVVEAMLQLDMTMYGANQTQTIGVMTDYVDPNLAAFLRLVINAYSTFPWENTKCGYGCSDHASWNRYGYRTCMPAEAIFSKSNPYIHTTEDLITRLNFARGLEFAKIGLGYVIELAGGSL